MQAVRSHGLGGKEVGPVLQSYIYITVPTRGDCWFGRKERASSEKCDVEGGRGSERGSSHGGPFCEVRNRGVGEPAVMLGSLLKLGL